MIMYYNNFNKTIFFDMSMSKDYKHQLIGIMKSEVWLMDVLKDVRKLGLPDWYVAAGAIRNTVWNKLHKFPGNSNLPDVDVVYFDSSDMEGKREKELERTLTGINPSLKWEVVNQARSHLFHHGREELSQPPMKSSCESISYWSETPTCIGARLEQDDSITICAPYGLDDLMNLIVRPIPKPHQNMSLYIERMEEKKWDKIWPKLKILD